MPCRMLKKAAFSPAQPRRAKTRRSAGKVAASEDARRTLRYVSPLSEARTKLTDFFSILLGSKMNDVGNAQVLNVRGVAIGGKGALYDS